MLVERTATQEEEDLVRDEVISILNWLDSKRPHLFSNILKEEFDGIVKKWEEALQDFSKREVAYLVYNGYYFSHFNYSDSMLKDLVEELNKQRYEKSAEGQAYLQSLIDEYYARHPHTEKVVEKEELSYESYHWGILIGDEWHLVDDTTLPFGREKPCRDNGRI